MRRAWAVIGTLAMVALHPLPLRAQQADGYVVAVQGRWEQQGGARALVVGSSLTLPTQLQVRDAQPGDRILVVAARSGAVLLSHQCAGPADCRAPLRIAAPAAGTGMPVSWAGMLARLMARLEAAPDRYVATLSRGDGNLRDLVLAQGEGALDLAPALAGLPGGRYALQLQPLDCREAACPGWQQSVDWQRGGRIAVDTQLHSGVHLLRVRPGGGMAAVAWHARVLVLPPQQQVDAAIQLRDWAQRVRDWGDGMDAAGQRSLLHALMDELARP